MSSTQPEAQIALKDRIAALQSSPQGTSTHPSAAPARSNVISVTGQTTTPPRGTLRDKINKFERKGGVPVPRGSFAMGAPPSSEPGVTKSRELYGNRIVGLGKQRPGAAPVQGQPRSVTAPSSFARIGTPDPEATPDPTPLSPDLTGESMPASSDSVPSADAKERRRMSVSEMIEQYNELDATLPPQSSSRRSSRLSLPPPAVTADATALPTPPHSAASDSPVTPKPSSRVTNGSERFGVEKREPQKRSAKAAPPMLDVTEDGLHGNSSTPGSELSVLNDAEIVSGVRVVVSPTVSKAVVLPARNGKLAARANVQDGDKTPTAETTANTPSTSGKRSNPPPPIGVISKPAPEPSLTPVPARTKSFNVVVHRKPNEQRNPSIDSGSNPAEPRRSASSADSHQPTHLRSKRQFKHLAASPEPPASPTAGNELSDLLKEAAWFEATLNTSFDIPAVTLDSAPIDTSLKAGESKPRAHFDSASLPGNSQLQVTNPQASTSTPALASPVDDDVPPTPPPKSARKRRFFSLRKHQRVSRKSFSSERSSDDSVPVATPPSPDMRHHDSLSMRSAKSFGSLGMSLRLSPHPRTASARAMSFADRMFGRVGKGTSTSETNKSKSPAERPYQLPSPVPESFDLSLASSPSAASFDFDAFPSVPNGMPMTQHSTIGVSAHTKAATDGVLDMGRTQRR